MRVLYSSRPSVNEILYMISRAACSSVLVEGKTSNTQAQADRWRQSGAAGGEVIQVTSSSMKIKKIPLPREGRSLWESGVGTKFRVSPLNENSRGSLGI